MASTNYKQGENLAGSNKVTTKSYENNDELNWDNKEDIHLSKTPPPYSKEDDIPKIDSPLGYTIDEALDKLGYGPFQFILFIFCGLIWMADAMELMILSVLSPAVRCQWSLSSVEEAFITSIVFIGFLFGSIFWGFISDNLGRKKAFLIMTSFVLVSGILSALKLTPDDARIPGYPWLLLCRFFVGFGVAGVAQATAYYIEFLPRRTRAICSVCLIGWFAIGTMFGAALALGVMGSDKYDWHWYIGLSAIPMAVVTVSVPFIPESARVLLSKGKTKEAKKVLKKIEWLNFRSLPPGELIVSASFNTNENAERSDKLKTSDIIATVSEDELGRKANVRFTDETKPLLFSSSTENSLSSPFHVRARLRILNGLSRIKLLFLKGMWRTTLPLWLLWFGAAWLYYGCVLLTTTMLQDNPHCENKGLNSTEQALPNTVLADSDNGSDMHNATSCEDGELDTADYISILWASAAELPGILITISIIEILGRKITMITGFLVAMAGYCLLFICTNNTILTVFFFIIRASVSGLFQTMYAYTPEVYPTDIRGLGIGLSSSVARFGAILTPYVAQVLFYTSDYATISLYAGTCLLLAFVVLLLPIETKGKSLKE